MADPEKPPVLLMALLVTGTTVGAGILGLPVTSGLAGALPALISMVLAWALMLFTGWVLMDCLVRHREREPDISTAMEMELGRAGQWLASLSYLVFLYGLLVAYLAGGASVLSFLFHASGARPWLMLGFFAVTAGISIYGLGLVRRCNAWLMLLMGLAFAVLVYKCAGAFQASRLARADWSFIPSAMPIIVCAFCFQCIIPTVTRDLGYDRKLIFRALLLGTGIALAFYLVWLISALAALPLSGTGQGNILAAFRDDQPATVPLAAALGSVTVTVSGMAFSLLAITTSFVGVGISLMGFWRDLLSGAERKFLIPALAFAPPLVLALLFPDLFLDALDIVGGGAIVFLFGLLPSLIFLRRARSMPFPAKMAGWLALFMFAVIMLLEVFQEAGWMKVSPTTEHWLLHFPRL
ncbi:MAG: aromatic amino acid transport family protein [Thermodesulfobacteriota bacterium]